MGFSSQEYWSGLPCPPPGDLPNPGIEPTMSLVSPALAGVFFTTNPVWEALNSLYMGFPGSSAGKESACNAGDPGSIPGLGRCPGEGIGYPLQYSWASLVAQMVKNLPGMWGTWIRSLGWEDPLEKGMATHSSVLAWRLPMHRGAWRATVHGVAKRQTQLSD